MGAQAVRLSNVDINNALENKDFEVLFQPIFDLGNGALARMETFVRWRHPSLGVLPPGAFISFFESQGRMGELTRYVLDNAIESYGEWRGPHAPGFSINLSLADLADDAFTSHLTSVVQTHDFPADLITLECPMPAVDSDLEGMGDRFAQLRETGARLAIEVRGRASDYLRTVDPFPFDEIKTGGSSILRFARTVRGPGLSAISDLLDIAKKANAVTTAVGVEDQASLAALKGLGFTAAQGNHLASVGGLSEFRPSQVNHVRELLELPPLNGDELAALFRTSAPKVQAGEDAEAPAASDVEETKAPDQEKDAAKAAAPASKEEKEDKKAVLARARKKAKAIALAKRAKARDARKAAAIKRAKAKVALAKQQTEDVSEADDSAAPRALQDRLAQEFTEYADAEAPKTIDVSAEPVEQGAVAEESDPQEAEPEEIVVEAVEVDDDEAPIEAPSSVQFKMPVGKARAHFRPGVRARGLPTSLGAKPFDAAAPNHQPAAAHGGAAAVDVAFEDETAVQPDGEDSRDDAVETAAPDNADPAPASAIGFDDNEEAGSMIDNHHSDDVPSPPRRKRKNFLTRRYKVVPTHFWPKPWTRAMRRRRVMREESAVEA